QDDGAPPALRVRRGRLFLGHVLRGMEGRSLGGGLLGHAQIMPHAAYLRLPGACAWPSRERGSITEVGSLMLLDTASLYYRAFYGMPETVTAPDGTPVNAIRGLLDAIGRLVREHQPARLIACLDADWRPAFRVAAIPSYKAHRAEEDGTEQTPPGLAVQIPLITQLLTAAGIATAEHEGYEADDVIATLATRTASGTSGPGPVPVDVVTGDRDLFQLAN